MAIEAKRVVHLFSEVLFSWGVWGDAGGCDRAGVDDKVLRDCVMCAIKAMLVNIRCVSEMISS